MRYKTAECLSVLSLYRQSACAKAVSKTSCPVSTRAATFSFSPQSERILCPKSTCSFCKYLANNNLVFVKYSRRRNPLRNWYTSYRHFTFNFKLNNLKCSAFALNFIHANILLLFIGSHGRVLIAGLLTRWIVNLVGGVPLGHREVRYIICYC